jgi:hypothetical protein
VFRGGADYPEVVHAHQQSGAHQLRSRLFDLQTGAGSSSIIRMRPESCGDRCSRWLAESLFSMLKFLATVALSINNSIDTKDRYSYTRA